MTRYTVEELGGIHRRLAADYAKLEEHWRGQLDTTTAVCFCGIDTPRNRARATLERDMLDHFIRLRAEHEIAAHTYEELLT